MTPLRTAASVVALALACTTLVACASDASIALPPEGGAPDYQLGGAYPPAEDVDIVARDRTDPPSGGMYSICYVNAFQTQPGERAEWPRDLVLRDANGDPVFDPAWPAEALLDTSTPQNRAAIADRIGPWITACADDGYNAVEFDNLDSHTRSSGLLTREDNAQLAALLVDIAHDAGLAAAQKNSAEDSARLRDEAGFDFAIAEECMQFGECDLYADAYGARVIDIEYADDLAIEFGELCEDPRMPASVVLRDRALTTPADPAYVFELCSD